MKTLREYIDLVENTSKYYRIVIDTGPHNAEILYVKAKSTEHARKHAEQWVKQNRDRIFGHPQIGQIAPAPEHTDSDDHHETV